MTSKRQSCQLQPSSTVTTEMHARPFHTHFAVYVMLIIQICRTDKTNMFFYSNLRIKLDSLSLLVYIHINASEVTAKPIFIKLQKNDFEII